MLKEASPDQARQSIVTAITTPGTSQGKMTEAQDALLVLGYNRSEALAALQGVDISSMELEDIIRTALKKLMK